MRPAVAWAVALALAGCQTAEGQQPPPPPTAKPAREKVQADITAQDYAAPTLPRSRVTLTDAYGGPHLVEVEVAATRDARTRGLMWRKVLPDGQGMLFIFAQSSVQGFWMRNTLIPLDMLFITEGGVVAGIVERAEPQTLTSRSVGKESKYVLEVPGGWCAKVGVVAGAKVAFEALQAIRVEP